MFDIVSPHSGSTELKAKDSPPEELSPIVPLYWHCPLVTDITSHPDQIQGVLTEMAFNLGKKGLSEFKNFLGLINSKKYPEASKEMLKSAWGKQVGKRAQTLAGLVSSKPVA